MIQFQNRRKKDSLRWKELQEGSVVGGNRGTAANNKTTLHVCVFLKQQYQTPLDMLLTLGYSLKYKAWDLHT